MALKSFQECHRLPIGASLRAGSSYCWAGMCYTCQKPHASTSPDCIHVTFSSCFTTMMASAGGGGERVHCCQAVLVGFVSTACL